LSFGELFLVLGVSEKAAFGPALPPQTIDLVPAAVWLVVSYCGEHMIDSSREQANGKAILFEDRKDKDDLSVQTCIWMHRACQ